MPKVRKTRGTALTHTHTHRLNPPTKQGWGRRNVDMEGTL